MISPLAPSPGSVWSTAVAWIGGWPFLSYTGAACCPAGYMISLWSMAYADCAAGDRRPTVADVRRRCDWYVGAALDRLSEALDRGDMDAAVWLWSVARTGRYALERRMSEGRRHHWRIVRGRMLAAGFPALPYLH